METGLPGILLPHCRGGVALAYSGGVDSALLLHALLRLQEREHFPLAAFFFRTPLQSAQEAREASAYAESLGVQLQPISSQLPPEVEMNPPERCYLCKRSLFTSLVAAAKERGLGTVMDGTNADDLQQYRPGLRALRELGVFSPLAAAGMGKAEIRQLAREWGLPFAEKPSSPCLATRFEYGARLTPEKLDRVARGEEALHRLFPGVGLRLRVRGEFACIELPRESFPAAVQLAGDISVMLRSLGFSAIFLDLQGLRSGSMDEQLLKNSHHA